ncbi:hypothetical protein GCM10018980_51260 [Streptomyces capoamus]|uniref:Uncharacterized protein n=1 Tax=Streptomyces capoamus TaxID=68183 RepID=A0A919EZC1_9ACTN|nr:hypothetical protein [Streptomyces capoamus]GGW15846.1 hypothetical protein GCM10010501_29550 [Streptomyces libani subsp. rufus]GHG61810.1 hypothetical protein GCM10018980_51260 [Streptomyces capoamus]
MITDLVRRLPRPLRAPLRLAGVHTGKHRGPRAVPGAIVTTEFVTCNPCGGVETAATRHGTVLRCAEGHEQAGTGAGS